MIRFLTRLAFAGLATAMAALPASAQISLVPTRLVLDERQASDYFTVRNTTGETLRYRVELVDLVMQEDGRVVAGDHDAGAADYLRYGPRVITLPPYGEASVRMQRRPGAPAGELRNHVRFEPVSLPIEEDEMPEQAVARVEVRLLIQAPVLIRSGPADLTVGLADPRLVTDATGARRLRIALTRSGAWSSYGDLQVLQGDRVIAQRRGLAVYPERDRIEVEIDLPGDASGPVSIVFSDRYLPDRVARMRFDL
ncbi:hypothetical protein [Maricaulis sp.]|uniref:hypothetical protein n=1 Tax=Maricaulis sp. TaxID=1486257 RepID=UPI0026359F13|nr:hypothetical protein [Maricaulis sp.]